MGCKGLLLRPWLASALLIASAAAAGRAGPPVAALERHGDAWTAELAGGVRAHVLTIGDPADDEAPVVVTAVIDAGEHDEDADERGLARFVAFAMGRPQSTGDGRPFELVEAIGVRLRVEASPSGIVVTAWCKPGTLNDALDAVAGAITSPGFDERTLDAWRIDDGEYWESYSSSAAGLLNETLATSLPGPQRALLQRITESDLEAVTVDRGRGFYEDHVLGGAARLAVVGAVEPLVAVDAIGEHFAQIGGRDPRPQGAELFGLDSNKDGRITATAVVEPNSLLRDGQSLVAVGVSGIGISDLPSVRALVMARGLLAEKLRESDEPGLREGWTWLTPGYAFRDFGTMLLVAVVPTDEADATERRLRNLLEEFAEDGPTDEQVASIRVAIGEYVDRQLVDPAWASRTMAEAEIVGFSIDELLSIREGYASISAADVRRELSKLLDGEGDGARMLVRVDADVKDNAAARGQRRR